MCFCIVVLSPWWPFRCHVLCRCIGGGFDWLTKPLVSSACVCNTTYNIMFVNKWRLQAASRVVHSAKPHIHPMRDIPGWIPNKFKIRPIMSSNSFRWSISEFRWLFAANQTTQAIRFLKLCVILLRVWVRFDLNEPLTIRWVYVFWLVRLRQMLFESYSNVLSTS